MTDNCYIGNKKLSFESPGPLIEYGKYDIRSNKLLRPYMPQFLNDDAKDKSVIKCRQSEFTVTTINDNLYYIIVHGCHISHVFPSAKVANSVSIEKISTAIKNSPEISEWLIRDAVHRYMFSNDGIYYIGGVLDKAAGRAPSRDRIVFDEYDSIPESIVPALLGSLKHSKWQMELYIGTGTVPGYGIDKKVKDGCEWEWEFTCPSCGVSQKFEFPDNIINFFDVTELDRDDPEYKKRIDEVYIGCKICKSYIDRNSEQYVANSRWATEKVSIKDERSSYYVVAPMLAWKTGKGLIQVYHTYESQGYISQFWNEEWGSAHIVGGFQLTDQEINSIQMQYHEMKMRSHLIENVSIGIDWGQRESWVVVSAHISGYDDKRSIIGLYVIDHKLLSEMGLKNDPHNHVEAASSIIEKYRPDIVIDDANGIGIYPHSILKLRFPGIVWGSFFDTAEINREHEQSKMLEPVWSESQGKVTLPKVKTIKDIMGEIRKEKLTLPIMDDPEIIKKFAFHHKNLIIQGRLNIEKNIEYQTAVKSGPDHFFDANMYSKIGFDKITGNNIVDCAGVA